MAAGCQTAPLTPPQRLFHFYDVLRELALKVEVPPLYCRCQIRYHSLLSPIIKEVATLWHLEQRSGGRGLGSLGAAWHEEVTETVIFISSYSSPPQTQTGAQGRYACIWTTGLCGRT